jgi:hypothetical protein
LDVACAFIPFATGGGVAAKAIVHGDDIAKIATRLPDIIKSGSRYVFRKAGELKNITRGAGEQVHHLIEKRFVGILQEIRPGTKASDIPSILLTTEQHAEFTMAWRKAIAYNNELTKELRTANAKFEDIREAVTKVYKDYPDIQKALLDWLDSL